jgi:hypothetical protein
MDNQVAAASRVLVKQTAAAFGLLGGLASLFYLSGFVYGISYFAGVGAPWLASVASVSRTVPGPAASFAALFTIAFILTRLRNVKLTYRAHLVFIATFFAVMSLFPLVISSSGIDLHDHSVFYTYAVIAAAFSGFACFELSINHHLEKSERARLHGVLSAAAAVCIVFVWIPALQGRAIALADLADPSHRLPTATVRIQNVVTTLPVLLITSERVFCLDTRQQGRPRLRAVTWPEIESLSTDDHR